VKRKAEGKIPYKSVPKGEILVLVTNTYQIQFEDWTSTKKKLKELFSSRRDSMQTVLSRQQL
jgi:hypothetical protein